MFSCSRLSLPGTNITGRLDATLDRRSLMPLPPRSSSTAVNLAQFEVSNPYHSQGLAAGGSALLDAVNRGKVHLAKFILDAGEYDVVNTRDFKGKTPLIRSCYIKDEKTRAKTVDLLLSRGADVNIQDDIGKTPLSYACELHCNDVVKILVKNNVDPDIPDNDGNTPLMYSSKVGNQTAIEILIKSFRRLGLSVDHVNDDGLTALLISAKNGNMGCATTLALEGRACVSFRDRERGMNAEQWARSRGCTEQQVLPFSANAALWGYKYSKYDPFNSTIDQTDESEIVDIGRNDGVDRIKNVDCGGDKNVESGDTSSQKKLDPDELNRRLAKTELQLQQQKLQKQMQKARGVSGVSRASLMERMRNKRGSLPTMKFFTGYQSYEDHRESIRVNQTMRMAPPIMMIPGQVTITEYTQLEEKGLEKTDMEKSPGLFPQPHTQLQVGGTDASAGLMIPGAGRAVKRHSCVGPGLHGDLPKIDHDMYSVPTTTPLAKTSNIKIDFDRPKSGKV